MLPHCKRRTLPYPDIVSSLDVPRTARVLYVSSWAIRLEKARESLLYLVTAELLREAHKERESAGATAMFFAWFLVFLVVGMTMD